MTKEATSHDFESCQHCFHVAEDGDPSGCWCPECVYAPDSEPPDNFEKAYRSHVTMSGMAPPHADGSRCTCLFDDSTSELRLDPGSRAESLYHEAYAEYKALMEPIWEEVCTSNWTSHNLEDPQYFSEVLSFDARMRALTKVPPLISELAREYAYMDARKSTVRPDYDDEW